MKDHKIINTMFNRGFGIHSINEALSLSYANGILKFCITPLPGFNNEPIYVVIQSREPRAIIEECQACLDSIITMYRGQLWHDLLYI